MTPWEYSAAVSGWMKANGVGEATERSYPTDEEFEDAIARLH
jgi:hypothetical protein